ncbi:PLP-dependent cysteine synthase family protein [Microbacterium sp. YY-03]|uniref:PLP-dependent cysteine synthase family protein n=1 Tax=Microbacterium sp. YY-03 TaxID=3421636 RepID=UPI003D185C89
MRTPPSILTDTTTIDVDRSDASYDAWVQNAIRAVNADAQRTADTHLLQFPLPAEWNIQLYLKDESTHVTGSLKHRLARSLFLYGLANGWIRPGVPVIEASSGSTAVSEAYFARLIGVPFIAVVPRSTSTEKTRLIEFTGGTVHYVDDARTVSSESVRLAEETGGHFIDQFTYAERATDWRGNNNVAESIFRQMTEEPHPEPTWIVTTAGTGGTSATIGRYVRYTQRATRIAVADPENSAFFAGWLEGNVQERCETPGRIEGIGRPSVEPSFLPTVIDRMMKVPDAASIATIHALQQRMGRMAGGSTGTGLWAALRIIAEMRSRGETGSVLTLLCDGGERYVDRYYNDDWLREQGIDTAPYLAMIDEFLDA